MLGLKTEVLTRTLAVENGGCRVLLEIAGVPDWRHLAIALAQKLQRRARVQPVARGDEVRAVTAIGRIERAAERLRNVLRGDVGPQMIVLDVGAARLELRILRRKDDVRRPDRDHLDLAAIGIGSADRLRAFLAERVEIDRPQRVVFVDRQILRPPSRRIVVQAERCITRRDNHAPHAAILRRLQHGPGALHIDAERDVRRRGARIWNGGEMHHRFLSGQIALQRLVVGDVALDRPNPCDVDRHAVEDCQIAALPQVFRDVAAEPAHASGNDDFLIPHVSSHLVLIVFSLCPAERHGL